MKPARQENPSEDPRDVAYIDAAIENYARVKRDTLAQESVPFSKEIEERIPQIRQFFVEYLRELGVNPEEDPDFSEAETGTVGEWFDDIENFYLPSVADSKSVGDGESEFAGMGSAVERWALISKKQMNKGASETIVNFYAPAALGHEIYHAMAAYIFKRKEDVEITSESSNWQDAVAWGIVYKEYGSDKADIDENGKPVLQNGCYVVGGKVSKYRREDWNWLNVPGEKRGTFIRRGNLLEEGLATIIELRIRDEFASEFPDMSERSEQSIQGWLSDHPETFQFREGLYIGDGFESSPDYDPKNNITPSTEYRKGVQVFKMLADKFTELTGDPWYFERLVQKARMLAKHRELWSEVENVVGNELAQRIKFVNSKNIDSVLEELKTKLTESGAS